MEPYSARDGCDPDGPPDRVFGRDRAVSIAVRDGGHDLRRGLEEPRARVARDDLVTERAERQRRRMEHLRLRAPRVGVVLVQREIGWGHRHHAAREPGRREAHEDDEPRERGPLRRGPPCCVKDHHAHAIRASEPWSIREEPRYSSTTLCRADSLEF